MLAKIGLLHRQRRFRRQAQPVARVRVEPPVGALQAEHRVRHEPHAHVDAVRPWVQDVVGVQDDPAAVGMGDVQVGETAGRRLHADGQLLAVRHEVVSRRRPGAALGGRGSSLAMALTYSNIVFGGVILIWLFSVPVKIRPFAISKANTFSQIVLAGFVLARAAAGLSDGTIASAVVMRPAGVPGRLSPGRAARRGRTEGSHPGARSTRPGGY
mgnify:CR=1 FL=1